MNQFALPHERPIFSTNEDSLGRAALAKEVKDLLIKAETPGMIGLYATWGSGKTSLLNLIHSELNQTACQEILPIYFGAWDHENPHGLVPSLMLQIRERIQKDDQAKISWLNVAGASALITTDTLLKILTQNTINIEAIKKSLTTMEDHATVKSSAELDAHLLLQRNLATALETTKKAGIKRLVLLIDDLDRCHPDNIFQFIDNLRRLLSIMDKLSSDEKYCEIVGLLAVDEDIINMAIRQKYPGLRSEPSEYLYKLLSLNLRLPPPSQEDIKKLLKIRMDHYGTNLNGAISNWSFLRDQIANTLTDLTSNSDNHVTPRHLLTFLRHLCFWLGTATEEDRKKVTDHIKITLSLGLIGVVSPSHFEEMLRWPIDNFRILSDNVLQFLKGIEASDYYRIIHRSPDLVWENFRFYHLIETVRDKLSPNGNQEIWGDLRRTAAELTGFY